MVKIKEIPKLDILGIVKKVERPKFSVNFYVICEDYFSTPLGTHTFHFSNKVHLNYLIEKRLSETYTMYLVVEVVYLRQKFQRKFILWREEQKKEEKNVCDN